MSKSERELQTLACFVHGVLVAFHSLGLLYNLKRRNYGDAAIHTLAGGYDLWATHKHWKAVAGDLPETST
jgi:hypothetical protein